MTAAAGGARGTAEDPYPVRAVAIRVQSWIEKLGSVWVEGQLTEMRVRGATRIHGAAGPCRRYVATSELPQRTGALRPGEARRRRAGGGVREAAVQHTAGLICIAAQRNPGCRAGRAAGADRTAAPTLELEGLFDPRLKRPLPFLPSLVGLITGRASAAEHDVRTVAAARWPAVRFSGSATPRYREQTRVAQIIEALRDLDEHPEVDVIVIARGGGSTEDLLPFSNESLCRAIAACRTPVVSAIGHEPDNPLCDLVADLRAATPTDAAKKVVPDTVAELALINDLRHRSARALRNWVGREERALCNYAPDWHGAAHADGRRTGRRGGQCPHHSPP